MAAAKKRAATSRPAATEQELRRLAASKRQAAQPRTPMARRERMVRISPSQSEVMEDPATLLDWDDEELRRGHRRGNDGKFPARQPQVIPRAVYAELWRRTVNTANEKMRDSLPEAVEILMSLARDPRVRDADRIKAIGMIMDRVLGKVPDKILFAETEMGTKPKWMDALDVAIVTDDEAPG